MRIHLKGPNAVGGRGFLFAGLRRSGWAVVALAVLLAHQSCAIRPAIEHPEVPEPVGLALSVVNGDTGEPVPNAGVKVSLYGEGISRRDRQKRLVTDAKGRCVVPIPDQPLDGLRVNIDAVGYVPVYASWWNPEDAPKPDPIPDSFVFPLEKGTSVGGFVKNEEGEPVERVRVYLMLPGGEEKIRYDIRERYATTDADGGWRSDILPEKIEQLWMNLKHPDYITSEVWGTIPVPPMKSLRNFTSIMVLKRGVTLSGIVRDEEGNPIENALVQVGSSGYSSKTTQTDEQGQFEFRNCEEGALDVSAQAPGRSPQIRRVFPDQIDRPLDFNLEPGSSIRIRVVDSNGEPIQGVSVTPETYKGYRSILKINPRSPQRGASTDKDGLVVWESAPADEVQYGFSKEGYARLDEVELIADGKEHTVTLPRPIKVSGTVVDTGTGEPIDTFRVVPVLDWLTGSTPYIERSHAFEAERGEYKWQTGRTDTGHYVRIEADGYLPAMSEMFRVGDAEEKTIDFKLKKGRNIEGVVRGIDGEPVEGAEVLLCTAMQGLYLSNGRISRPDDTYRVETGADGRFSFPPETDPYLLVVLHDTGYAQVTGEEVTGSGEVRIQPWGRIEGKLVQHGKPVASYQVRMGPIRVSGSDGPNLFSQYYTTTDETGAFVFERVSPGPVSLTPDLGPWQEYELTSAEHVPLVIEPGETAQVSLGTEGRSVVGKVVLPPGIEREMRWDYGLNYLVALKDGIPVPEEIRDLGFDWRQGWNEVWNASQEGRAYFQTLHRHFVKLNTDGTFRIEGVREGKYQLVLRIVDPPQGMG